MKKAILILYRIILLISVIGIVGQVAAGVWSNRKLESAFTANDQWTDYREGIPVSEMDFSQYAVCFERNTALIGYSTEFVNSRPIVYYQEMDGAYVPAYEIPAGTVLEWETSEICGYGLMAFPTDQAGWRWGKPFRAVGSAEETADTWYYIKTQDLQSAALQVLNSSQYLQSSAQAAGMTDSEFAEMLIHRTDNVLYANGIYISPELYVSVWTPGCSVLAAVILIAVVVRIMVKKSIFKVRKGRNRNFHSA